MIRRVAFTAVISGVVLGAAGTCPAQAQNRATLENLLTPQRAAPAKPPERSSKAEKLPSPGKAAVDEAIELVRQAYEEDLKSAKENPEQVVNKLLAAARATADPAQKYAILLVAEKTAVEANRSMLALTTFDIRAVGFTFDDAQERIALLEVLQKRSVPIDESMFRYVAQVVQQALDADEYEQAEKAAGLASAAAKAIDRAEKALAAEAKRKRQQPPEPTAAAFVDEAAVLQKTVREQKSLSAAYAVAKDKLAAKPDDPEAAEVVGKHLCFVKRNWKEGLVALAKCRSQSLKELAGRELMLIGEGEPDTKALFTLAGDWWKLAEAKDEALNEGQAEAVKKHAAGIYSRLKGKLLGSLEAAIVEKRRTWATDSNENTQDSFLVGAPNQSSSQAGRPKAIPKDAVRFRGQNYFVFQDQVNRREAVKRCEELGGHLVRVESAEEWAFVARLLLASVRPPLTERGVDFWIDGNDSRAEGEWESSDEIPIQFFAWRQGEPNNVNNEDFIMATVSLNGVYWFDVGDRALRFVCEWDKK